MKRKTTETTADPRYDNKNLWTTFTINTNRQPEITWDYPFIYARWKRTKSGGLRGMAITDIPVTQGDICWVFGTSPIWRGTNDTERAQQEMDEQRPDDDEEEQWGATKAEREAWNPRPRAQTENKYDETYTRETTGHMVMSTLRNRTRGRRGTSVENPDEIIYTWHIGATSYRSLHKAWETSKNQILEEAAQLGINSFFRNLAYKRENINEQLQRYEQQLNSLHKKATEEQIPDINTMFAELNEKLRKKKEEAERFAKDEESDSE